jgi:Leucine-rich repeat (LRR) protein
MLEGLDAVDWGRLSHAYGEATNVPEMLRGLTSDDRDERENAFDGLFWSIHHQGTIYDATAPAVPFLLELVDGAEVQDRDRILDLLAAIAGGCGYDQVHQVYEKPETRASAEFQHSLAEERDCQQQVRDAVWRGWPVFLRLLHADDEALRREALNVVGRLLVQPRMELPSAVADLVACLREAGHPAAAGILVGLGEAARFHADPGESLRAAIDHRERDIELSNMDDLRENGEKDHLPAWLALSEEDHCRGREALAVLWTGWPVFGSLADAVDAAVREGALFLKALLLRFAGTAAPAGVKARAVSEAVARWLRRLETARDEREQADLLFALAAVAPQDTSVLDALRRALHPTRGLLVGYVAALKLVDLTGAADDRGLDLLLDVYQDSREVYDALQAMPRWEPYWVTPRLARLGPGIVERRLPAFVEMVRSAGNGIGSSGQVRELLRLAFGGKPLPPGGTVLDLTEAQRQLLLAAADNGHFWATLMNHSLALDRLLGLPGERRDLRRFLARPGEPVSQPRNDPEDALVQFECLVARRLPFEVSGGPYHREEGDTRAPFRMIQEGVEEMRRIADAYRPKDRPHIRRLEPHGHACDALVALLPLCPNLQHLDLSFGEATDASMHHLAQLPHLSELNLYGNGITDAGLVYLAGLTDLRDLGLSRTDITDAGLQHLAGLVSLRKLNLSKTGVKGSGLAYLRGARELEVLWLVTDHLTDEAVPPIGEFPALQELHVRGDDLTGKGLETWEGLVSLKELSLSGRLIPEYLGGLAKLPALEKLRLDGDRVGDEHTLGLPALPGLKTLSLWRAGITDAALAGLDRFPSLERLDVSWTRVTDAVLPHLLRLKNIRWVGLYRTGVGPDTVEQLRRAFPEAHFST